MPGRPVSNAPLRGGPVVPGDPLERVLTALREGSDVRLVGAVGGFRGYALAMAASRVEAPVFTVAPDEASARALAGDAAFFLGAPLRDASDGPVLVVPEIDTSPYADAAADPRTMALRLAALYRLVDRHSEPPKLIVASVRSLRRRVIPPPQFQELCTRWGEGDELPREAAIAALQRAGYTRVDVVEDPGTYAVRGGVIDLFVGCSRFPTRVEFDDDLIERLRLFDPESQRSLRPVTSVSIHPVRETVATTAASLRARVLALADAALAPSSKSRQIVDNLEQGLEFFGVEALTPIFHDAMAPLWDYLPRGTRWVIEEPDALLQVAEEQAQEAAEQYGRAQAERGVVAPPEQFFVPDADLGRRLRAAPVVLSRLLVEGEAAESPESGDRPEDAGPKEHAPKGMSKKAAEERPAVWLQVGSNKPLRTALEASRADRSGEAMRPLVDQIRALQAETPTAAGDLGELLPWTVLLVVPGRAQVDRLIGALRGHGLAPEALSPEQAPIELRAPTTGTRVQVAVGELSEGFDYPAARLLVLSEFDLFGKSTRRAQSRRRTGLSSLSQLGVGDYVVHLQHGVGRYAGLVQLQLGGAPGDYVQLEYAGGDKLYLPVYRLSEIERYVAAEGKPPKLDKMGGSTFLVKANKVKTEVRQMAEELLQIYAQRESTPGTAFPGPDEYDQSFADSFPFQETPDQETAIDAVQGDLGRARPMDRLICGDVGFGKTEVALRAAFRVAQNGRQVAVLAPTTVLVQQHGITFRERLAPFDLRVEVLNRFSSDRQQKRVIEGIAAGEVDVVVGTHRLLGKDVRFKDLGLLVIDEEQRFGVAQKERFKKFKAQVDVLTMSATPIPRTLHMSLLGLREISMIRTPPIDRLAVRTAIVRIGDAVIEEGITRELARGGQVFYVVPKILGIEEHAVRIRELVPHARVLVAHGQMPEEMLERTMLEFVEHRADVLVSTTIIESGLDIPRANTMFIAHAEQFGLAQLYQLRGRVGRSKQRAHCYLMVQALERLSPEARRRLEAIQRHAELGSGFGVAVHDLEIRGAGELLGARQSGQIQAIGFDAYARILQEAVAELRGEPILRETDPEIAFDTPAYLPEAYVRDVGQRLDLYRRLSAARDRDAVEDVMSEITDRYGEAPLEAEHLGLVMICKTYGRRLGALAVELKGTRLAVRLGPDTPLSGETAGRLNATTHGKFKLQGDRVVATVPEARGPDRRTQLKVAVAALAELTQIAESKPVAPAKKR
ncbi:transcription-repair coupling factor [Nannocystis punicea]|uniref:Transcription-repair-coupling factor n=1 Tax=Nannocystis punicea TaxID=2995304 RepID=A0ABY7GTL7_9BACT|nr:transcription-repair coupling factor [Nannocystis poenicansa]WAS90248.1 transcription-repair coupling factor [Nannocystis poenicansa]